MNAMTILKTEEPTVIDTIVRDYVTGTRDKRYFIANDIADMAELAQDDIRRGDYLSVSYYANRIVSIIRNNLNGEKTMNMRDEEPMGLAIAVIHTSVLR